MLIMFHCVELLLNFFELTITEGIVSLCRSCNLWNYFSDILDAFEDLNNTASEGAFKEFLMKFKHNSEQVGHIYDLSVVHD